MTPIHRRLCLQWCRARRDLSATKWNQVVISDESRFNLSSDGNRVRVWRTRAQQYVHDILQTRVLPLMAGLQEPFFNKSMLGHTQQGSHKTATTLPPYPGLP
ncbi:hypothetical protein TNCV_57461 [Trichonephila clavipes]|nr:hypothetical protein TNCV_57461 [Trichonephila clavipes]